MGFVQQVPTNRRMQQQSQTLVNVATPMDDVKECHNDMPNGHEKPKITSINSAEEYLDFLAQDDRLCMVK